MIHLAAKNILILCRPPLILDLTSLTCCLLLFIQELSNHALNPKHLQKLFQNCSKNMIFLLTSFIQVLNTLVMNMKKSLKFTTIRLKGPSKENKKEPIVGLGLLLDANQIPIGMKMFPRNESEKPVLRNIIDDLKQRNNISGRKYINLTRNSSFVKDLSVKTGLPLTSYFLGNEDINKVLNHRF